MRDAELARRLTTYMDSIVALAVVNLIAFGSALADSDVRCAFAHIRRAAIAGNLLMGLAYVGSIVACSRAQARLRREAEDGQSPHGKRIEKMLCVARYALVCLATGGAIGVVIGSGYDSSCLAK